MLIARAPVRVSLVGGGTDLESYYRRFGGLVVSATIDRYFYVFVSLNGTKAIQVTSSDYRAFFRHQPGQPALWDGDLALPRVLLDEFGIEPGVSIFLASEIPPGTGLGSSSAVSVALTKAFSALCGLQLGRAEIAELACRVEIERLGMPIGRQDQYSSAFGGLNVLSFGADGVQVEPLGLPGPIERALERRLMLFFTGSSHAAATILRQQDSASRGGDETVVANLHRIHEAAGRGIGLLRSGDLAGFGALLDEAWEAKKRLAPGITTPTIDRWYEVARTHGAEGGKIAGAGGGGFLLLSCPEQAQAAVTAALDAEGLVRMDFSFERAGATILMDAIPRLRALGTLGPVPLGVAS